MTEARRMPVPTPDTRRYWDDAALGVLSIPRCDDCAAWIFYPRSHCPSCFGRQVTWHAVTGRGTLYSYVISHVPAPGFEVPFVIAVVELEEGVRLMTNIVGVEPVPESLSLDMPLRVVFETQGGVTVPRFTPVGDLT